MEWNETDVEFNSTEGTKNVTTDDGYGNLPWYTIYILEGLVIGGGNWIIAICILRYEALRTSKEYFFIMGLAIADGINMLAYLTAGVYRSWIVLSGRNNNLTTPWECATRPYVILWSFSSALPNLNLAVISFDRMLFVAKPLEYIGWSKSYAKVMVCVAYCYALGTGLPGLLLLYGNDQPTLAPMCLTPKVMSAENSNPLYSYHRSIAPPFFACVSVLLYIRVWFMYSKRNTVSPEVRGQQEQINTQRRVTKTLGIGCVCTSVFYIVPFSLGQVTSNLGVKIEAFSLPLFFFVLAALNALCNVFLYPLRHDEIKIGLRGLFLGKEMPSDIKMWKRNQEAALTKATAQSKK